MLIQRIILVGVLLLVGAFGLFEWAEQRGLGDAVALTVAVNVFFFVELMYLFNCRSLTRSVFTLHPLSNRWVLGGVGLMIALQLSYIYPPFMNTAFKSAPREAWLWLPIFAVGLVAFVVVEVEKWVRRRAVDAERAERGRCRMSVECGGLTAAAPPE